MKFIIPSSSKLASCSIMPPGACVNLRRQQRTRKSSRPSGCLSAMSQKSVWESTKSYVGCCWFFLKSEYINIPTSASTNAYGCSLLQTSEQNNYKESQKQSFEPSRQKRFRIEKKLKINYVAKSPVMSCKHLHHGCLNSPTTLFYELTIFLLLKLSPEPSPIRPLEDNLEEPQDFLWRFFSLPSQESVH
jgi:hypothetical protein